ncbi:hypothetical protein [Labrenzia sp. OB1]|uniref:hypothetical protein n=1 Tax=Labrenzia sp. OB1 TaxID=1561204 RepID=UPI0007B1D00E|nr:hypothetical protein [Labrenzia sp. OB1]KZM47463.1 hypothetical protein OA90_25680 [Labrenzia sp. OB1]
MIKPFLRPLPSLPLPPLPTLGLAAALGAAAVCTPFLMAVSETSGLAPGGAPQDSTGTAMAAADIWAGPRAEAKREILIAPLFTENRKLPDLFNDSQPEPAVVEEPVAFEPPPDELIGMNPPSETPPEPAAEELPMEDLAEAEDLSTEPVAEPAEPLDLPELRLVGTFILESKGIARALLIEEKEGAEETWVDEDGKYEDWVLTIVSSEAVRLVGGEESLTLELWVEEHYEDGKTEDGTVRGSGLGLELSSGN